MRLALTCRRLAERQLDENSPAWFRHLHAIRYSSDNGFTHETDGELDFSDNTEAALESELNATR